MKNIKNKLGKLPSKAKRILLSSMALIMSLVIGISAGAVSSFMSTPTKVTNTLYAGSITQTFVELTMATNPAYYNSSYESLFSGLVGDDNMLHTYLTDLDTGYCFDNLRYIQIIPGTSVPTDLSLVVREGSEECWMFMVIKKSEMTDDYYEFTINSDWIPFDDPYNEDPNRLVYYTTVSQSKMEQPIPILQDNAIHIKDTVTRTMANSENLDKTEIFLYSGVIQKEGLATAEQAWEAAYTNYGPLG